MGGVYFGTSSWKLDTSCQPCVHDYSTFCFCCHWLYLSFKKVMTFLHICYLDIYCKREAEEIEVLFSQLLEQWASLIHERQVINIRKLETQIFMSIHGFSELSCPFYSSGYKILNWEWDTINSNILFHKFKVLACIS